MRLHVAAHAFRRVHHQPRAPQLADRLPNALGLQYGVGAAPSRQGHSTTLSSGSGSGVPFVSHTTWRPGTVDWQGVGGGLPLIHSIGTLYLAIRESAADGSGVLRMRCGVLGWLRQNLRMDIFR